MYKYTEVKFEAVSSMIESMKGISGVYIFHSKKHFFYVGKAGCFRHRFKGGYLKGRNSKQYIPEDIQVRIELGLDLSVIFIEIPKALIHVEEAKIISMTCPWINEQLNPRESIRSIQRDIGDIVQSSQREWSYEEITRYLFFYRYGGQIATKRIEEALENKNSNLSRYCSVESSKRILKPRVIA